MNKQTVEEGTIMAIDPVCGMKVNKQKAAATIVYNGETYYFCKSGCKARFEKDPEKLIEEGPLGMLGMMRELILGVFKK
jgi:YHS domain-containing protein